MKPTPTPTPSTKIFWSCLGSVCLCIFLLIIAVELALYFTEKGIRH